MTSQKSSLFSFIVFFALISPAWAQEKFSDHLGATLGASYSAGKMENNRMGLNSRTMSALSLDALGGYRVGDYLIGLDFDFRNLNQVTGLVDAGNTNLTGQSWMVGLGAKYTFNPKWSFQTSLGFLGKYNFKNQTATSKDGSLQEPLSIRIKPQYFPISDLPLSVDLDLRYISWQKFEVGSTDYKIPTTEFSLGAGVTYHFGGNKKKTAAEPVATSTPPPEKIEEPKISVQDQIAQLKVDHFPLNSSRLNTQAKTNLEKIAKILNQNPKQKIKVSGYTDTSGREKQNVSLSKHRAENAKKVLIQHGIKSQNISTQGFGESHPIADNQTEEGRELNRRVEISIDESAK